MHVFRLGVQSTYEWTMTGSGTTRVGVESVQSQCIIPHAPTAESRKEDRVLVTKVNPHF